MGQKKGGETFNNRGKKNGVRKLFVVTPFFFKRKPFVKKPGSRNYSPVKLNPLPLNLK